MAFLWLLWRHHGLALILLLGADMNPRRTETLVRAPLALPLCLRGACDKVQIGMADGRYFLVTKEIGA